MIANAVEHAIFVAFSFSDAFQPRLRREAHDVIVRGLVPAPQTPPDGQAAPAQRDRHGQEPDQRPGLMLD